MQENFPDKSAFFSNRECLYFPCHEGIAPNEFNCMFCYCPLYALGAKCGGAFSYTEDGIKDCSQCTIMHRGDIGAKLIEEKFGLLSELASNPEE